MLTVDNLSLRYGDRVLFSESSLHLKSKRRYGVVGANGAGKSTLLKLFCGIEEPTSGKIETPKHFRIGWLRQDQFVADDTPIAQAVFQGHPELWKAWSRREQLVAENEWDDARIEEICSLEEIIGTHGGYEAEGTIEKILIGLGIPRQRHQEPLKVLSGGFRWRVLLAQVLFANPDALILDEPTNHLDLPAIIWLERFLCQEFGGMVIFVSHDERFLSQVATDIIDIDYRELRHYALSYEAYVKEKVLMAEQVENERSHLEERRAELQRFVDRFKAKPSKARQAMARQKMIHKMEIPEVKKTTRREPYFLLKPARPSGKIVLEARALSKSFGAHQVVKKASLHLTRGQKLGIIGANGQGKSTLLRLLINDAERDEGALEYGSNVCLGYFAQDKVERLPKTESPLSWLRAQHPEVDLADARQALGQVLLTKDQVDRPIEQLSGGERSRLIMASLMVQKPNFLALDEPTNHLDLEGIRGLMKSLKNYEGTLLVVSHNRFFLEGAVDQWLVVPTMHIYDDIQKAFAATLEEDVSMLH